MKKFLSILAAAAALVACNKGVEPEIAQTVSLEPLITRALALNFNNGDQVGVKIIMNEDASVFAENAQLTYNGTVFSGEQKWYADGAKTSTLVAYYPYQSAFPISFTVAADQSAGTESSDFMTAVMTNVRPSSAAITAPFRHQFVQLDVVVNADFDVEVESVVLKNLNPTATIAYAEGAVTVAADAAATKIDITPETLTANKKFAAIVVPQDLENMGLEVKIKNSAATLVNMVDAATLVAGYRYTITVTASADMVTAQISGQIADWQNGGDLGGGTIVDNPVYEDHITDGYIKYHDVRYNVATFAEKVWMTEPLIYVPEGITVSGDPSAAASSTTGVFYPYSSDGTTCTPLTDEESIKKYGYFYKLETAFGAEITTENYTSFEGTQGICPTGWHIPTRAEYFALCGNSNKSVVLGESAAPAGDPTAYFWDSTLGYASIAKFNEGGFNYYQSGSVANNIYQKLNTSSTTCTIEDLVGNHATTYYMTSSAQSLSSSNSPQYFVLMTTFTSANSKGKISLSQADCIKVSSTLRCVKD